MKVTVTKFLNVRIGAPDTAADCYQYLAPGSVIEVDEKPVTGTPYEHNAQWYRDKANNFYWAGGLSIPAESDLTLFPYTDAQLDWYHKEFRITDLWKDFGTQGQGANVAVIDSGIDRTNLYFKSALVEGADYTNKGSPVVIDKLGHGTGVASIIIANGPRMIGVAPKARLFVAKVCDTGSPSADSIASVIDKIPAEIKIVVISNSFRRHDFPQALENSFKNSNRIFLCSAGNDGSAAGIINKYPASIQSGNILSIAATKTGGIITDVSTKSDFIALAAPGGNMKRISITSADPVLADGTSYSAPLVGGVLALMESVMKASGKLLSNQELINILLGSVRSVNPAQPTVFGRGIVDPYQALSQLNQILNPPL